MIEKNLEKVTEILPRLHNNREKKRSKGNWKQRLIKRRFSLTGEPLIQKNVLQKRIIFKKKGLLYLFFLNKMTKNLKNEITYLNLKLLKIFLTKYAKIKPRRKTRIRVYFQKQIAKAIRRARVEGLLPFTTKVILTQPIKKRKTLLKFISKN